MQPATAMKLATVAKIAVRVVVLLVALAIVGLAIGVGVLVWSETDDIVLSTSDARTVFGFLLALLPLLIITDSLSSRDQQIAVLRELNEKADANRKDRRTLRHIERGLSQARKRLASEVLADDDLEEANANIQWCEESIKVIRPKLDESDAEVRLARRDALDGSFEYLWTMFISGIGLVTALFGVVAPTTLGLQVTFAFAVAGTTAMIFGFFERFTGALPLGRSIIWGTAALSLPVIAGAAAFGLVGHVSVA